MRTINRVQAAFLSLCLIWSLGGCGNLAKDAPEGENGSWMESSDAEPEDGLTQSLAATVQIFADDFQGSGIIYGQWEDGLVLVTAGHVIPSGCREVQIVFGDGKRTVCTDYQLMEDADGAFLTVKEEALPGDWREKYGIVTKDRERFDAMQSGDSVFLADYQADNDLGCRFAMVIENWIYVEDFASHMMLLSGEAHGGMSGCGVFEENGCFLGILCGGNEEGELAVLPYSIIETNFLKSYSDQTAKLLGENY